MSGKTINTDIKEGKEYPEITFDFLQIVQPIFAKLML